jgi:hypothetical protein
MPEGFRPFPLSTADPFSFIPGDLTIDGQFNVTIYCQITADGRLILFPNGITISAGYGLIGMISYPI